MRQQMRRFLNFGSLAIYFPEGDVEREPSLLAAEKRLLLPLIHNDTFLGMAVLDDVSVRDTKKVMAILPGITSACLEMLALRRALDHHKTTSLLTEEALFAKMEDEVNGLRELLQDPGRSSSPLYRICFGMIVIGWHDARHIANKYDYNLTARIFSDLAKRLAQILPSGVMGAPLGVYEGRHEFGLLFTATGRQACQRLARKIVEELEHLTFSDALSRSRIRVTLHAGHALYPQDMAGGELRLPIFEQAMRLRDRARYASRIAASLRATGLADRTLSFAGILQNGGRVLEELGGGRLRVNLGLAANAREGMRFNVHPPQGGESIGQLVLLEAGPRDSVAETLFVVDATRHPMPGDQLRPGRQDVEDALWSAEMPAGEKDAGPILGHGSFITAFAAASRNLRGFVLGMARINTTHPESATAKEDFLHKLQSLVLEEAKTCATMFFAGNYGSNDLAFFHAHADISSIKGFYEKLHATAAQCGLGMASGLFKWPFLDYTRAESEACALKALEYAILLPEPHIGLFDSLALNISADRIYSLGDAFGAIEEYKRALLADSSNATARNSLGVCLAGLGKMEEAKKQFEKALADCQNDALRTKICYNIGTLCQKQGDNRRARLFYRRSIKFDGTHLFAWLRLGQLSEQKGRKSEARGFYEKAAALAGGDVELANLAQRQLARIEAMSNGPDAASDILHDSLLRDPADAASIVLLARIYLESGGDAALAETLARRSANLNGSAEAWETLSRALAAQGRAEEAEEAMARSKGKI